MSKTGTESSHAADAPVAQPAGQAPPRRKSDEDLWRRLANWSVAICLHLLCSLYSPVLGRYAETGLFLLMVLELGGLLTVYVEYPPSVYPWVKSRCILFLARWALAAVYIALLHRYSVLFE